VSEVEGGRKGWDSKWKVTKGIMSTGNFGLLGEKMGCFFFVYGESKSQKARQACAHKEVIGREGG